MTEEKQTDLTEGQEAPPFPGQRISELVDQMTAIDEEIRQFQGERRKVRKQIKDLGVQLGALDVALKLKRLQDDGADINAWEESLQRCMEVVLEDPQQPLDLDNKKGNGDAS